MIRTVQAGMDRYRKEVLGYAKWLTEEFGPLEQRVQTPFHVRGRGDQEAAERRWARVEAMEEVLGLTKSEKLSVHREFGLEPSSSASTSRRPAPRASKRCVPRPQRSRKR